MNKAVILIFVLLIGIIPNIQAQSNPNEPESQYKIFIEDGWNLVFGLTMPRDQILSQSEVKTENIKAIYAFLPQYQQYLKVYPEIEDYSRFGQIDDDYLENTGFWVYSDKRGFLEYETSEDDFIPTKERQLYRGWNFLGMTHDTQNAFIKKGSCNIERMVGWERGAWNELTRELLSSIGMSYEKFSFIDDETDAGHVILLKVTNNCMLDLELISGLPNQDGQDGIGAPPPIGENTKIKCSDSDGGLNYATRGVTGASGNSYTDYCPTNDVPNTLVEYTCDSPYRPEMTSNHYVCPNGCQDGACL